MKIKLVGGRADGEVIDAEETTRKIEVPNYGEHTPEGTWPKKEIYLRTSQVDGEAVVFEFQDPLNVAIPSPIG